MQGDEVELEGDQAAPQVTYSKHDMFVEPDERKYNSVPFPIQLLDSCTTERVGLCQALKAALTTAGSPSAPWLFPVSTSPSGRPRLLEPRTKMKECFYVYCLLL